MALSYWNLDDATRTLMLDEMSADAANDNFYRSKRLTASGEAKWPVLLRNAVQAGDDHTLAGELRRQSYLETHEIRHRHGRPFPARVPHTAADTLAEGEFNRLYCRAVCRRAISEGTGVVEVYRAKVVSKPRPRSERLIGTDLGARRLLDDLGANRGVDTALGIPAGPNSGLSVRLPENE